MQLSSLKEYLDKHNIKYVTISHSPAYTAQGIAALTHIPGKELAKTVIIKLDGKLIMAVLPASFQVDLGLLKKATKAKAVELRRKTNLKTNFPSVRLARCRHLEMFTDLTSSPMKAWPKTKRSHSMQALTGN